MASAGTVLITGGGRGIGAEAARLLAAAGHDVCFTYERRHDAAATLVREIEQAGHRAFAIQADAADPASAARVLQAVPLSFAPLAALVNNAGITGPLGSFADVSHATLRQVMDVNVLGPMYLTQAVVARSYSAGRAAEGARASFAGFRKSKRVATGEDSGTT